MFRTKTRRRGPREVQAFCGRTGRWDTVANPDPAGRASTLSVATQNVWFSELAWAERADGLVNAIEAAAVDIVCLQEVTPRLLDYLCAKPVIREQYRRVCSAKIAVAGGYNSYGTMMLSRLPISTAWELPFESRMHRSLLVATIPTSSGPLAVATSHLESMRPNRSARVAQLRATASALADAPEAILVGDFNFEPGAAEERAIDPHFVDVWRHLRPHEPGFTEDTARNPMRFGHYQEAKQVRYDRILGKLTHWLPTHTQLFADTQLNDAGLCVSDHFGVLASFSRRPR